MKNFRLMTNRMNHKPYTRVFSIHINEACEKSIPLINDEYGEDDVEILFERILRNVLEDVTDEEFELDVFDEGVYYPHTND
jgi:hypothetical protein